MGKTLEDTNMKVSYTYTEYKDCPEATEISKNREMTGYFLRQMCFCLLVVSVILAITSSEDFVSSILGILLFGAPYIYMIKVYPKVTQKKIKKAIEESIRKKEKLSRN